MVMGEGDRGWMRPGPKPGRPILRLMANLTRRRSKAIQHTKCAILAGMNYWVAPGGQQQGPFSLADVRRMIAEGRVAMNDLAWAEGLPNWAPLSQVIPAEAPAPPPPVAAQPNYGSISAQAVD